MRPRRVSRQLALVTGLLVAVVGCLFVVTTVQLGVMSAVRAYVGGEGLWSKSQKAALFHLSRYATTSDEREYARFEAALAVPLGDRRARVELERARPDAAGVAAGFVAGRNHSSDVAGMARFFRDFRRVRYVADAIAIWTAADREVARLAALGRALHDERVAREPGRRSLAEVLRKLDRLDTRVTPLEDAFSATLGEGARWLRGILVWVFALTAALLVGGGVLLAWMALRQIWMADAALRAEARISAALARAGRDLIAARDVPTVAELLCRLTCEGLGRPTGQTILREESGSAVAIASVGDVPVLAAPRRGRCDPFQALAAADVAELAPGLVGLALRHDGELVGVQLVGGGPSAPLGDEDRRIAEGIAHVASMALANLRLVAELERASRLKSEFVSTMSHELRTPLNVILGYAEMARDADVDAERERGLRRIELAAHDLLGLIESTLEVGRIDAGRDVVRLEEVDLAAFLAPLGETCARLPRRPDVAFEWPSPAPACVLTTDPRKLTVVLRNLVGNALKFTERGAVRLDVVVRDDAVELSVADTGIGIRPEDQETVFEMFRQADGSDTRRFGGTGLGLYIVRRFVDRLGGRIARESAPGRGSTFRVTLPRGSGPDAVVSRAA
jgi:signal transduction histidine kinase